MVKKLLGLLTREVAGLHNAAYLLAFFTILSQVLALVRDRLFAAYFGAGQTLDIYYAAFKIPDLIFISFASFVSISVLVPFIVERLKGDDAALHEFVSTLFSFFLFLIIVVSAVAYLFIPALSKILFPGIEGQLLNELILLTRIMLLSPILLGISNFFASVTQAYKRFGIYAISPLLYNFGIIIGVVVFYPFMGVAGLAWGVIAGALMHFLLQVPFVVQKGLFPKLTLVFKFHVIKEVVILSVGRTLALASSNVTTIFLLSIGSLMTVGSIAVFNLSWNLQSVPLAIVGASYSVALFPTISKHFSDNNRELFIAEMLSAARHIVFWSLPITVLFIVLRAQIVRTVLGSGAFSWSDTRLVAASLAVFSVSVAAQGLVLLFVRAYYASGRTKIPLFINFISGIIAIGLSFALWKLYLSAELFRGFFESLLRIEGIPGTEAVMLPLGYTIGILFNLAFFWYAFHHEAKGFSRPLLSTFFQSFSASVIMGFVSYLGLQWFAGWFNLETLPGIFMQGLLAGLLGIGALIVVLRALGSQELHEVWTTLHHKIWKEKIIVSEESL